MSSRNHDITCMTGFELRSLFQELYISAVLAGEKDTFSFKIDSNSFRLFEIKAMKQKQSIENHLTFYEDGTAVSFSWNKVQEDLSKEEISSYYCEQFHSKSVGQLVDESKITSRLFKICVMLEFEIARCPSSTQKKLLEAVYKTFTPGNPDGVTLLFKMFPQKAEKRKIQEDGDGLSCKISKVSKIFKALPQQEQFDDVTGMLSEDAEERRNAFDNLLEKKETTIARKAKWELLLLSHPLMVLDHLEAIMTATDVKTATTAFKKLDQFMKKKTKLPKRKTCFIL